MKTSNKLLFGLFIFTVLIMIIGTLTIKNRMESQTSKIPQEQINASNDSLSINSDSTNFDVKIVTK